MMATEKSMQWTGAVMSAQCIYCNRFTSRKSGGKATRLAGEYGGSIGEEWEWVCRSCIKKGRH